MRSNKLKRHLQTVHAKPAEEAQEIRESLKKRRPRPQSQEPATKKKPRIEPQTLEMEKKKPRTKPQPPEVEENIHENASDYFRGIPEATFDTNFFSRPNYYSDRLT